MLWWRSANTAFRLANSSLVTRPLRHHIDHVFDGWWETLLFDFIFTPQATALIDFCQAAEQTHQLYDKAIVMLYDLFNLRRDPYDRLYNEERYVQEMNASVDQKRVMLRWAVGDTILDIGPGGGAMLDLAADTFPASRVIGIDIAENIVRSLKQRRQVEGRRWEIWQGDALQLRKHFAPASIDTILMSSVLHEFYSYIYTSGLRFNLKTIRQALRSAFEVLRPGGRIIIRYGIMTEPKEEKRILRFQWPDALDDLARFAADFKGRQIQYEMLGEREVLMPVNDCMEFLYTWTWGPESYPHEVQEQFGYLTPSEWRQLIAEELGSAAHILHLSSYLQPGYTHALSSKVALFKEDGTPTPLPDSTCLLVIEKQA